MFEISIMFEIKIFEISFSVGKTSGVARVPWGKKYSCAPPLQQNLQSLN